MSPLHLPSIPAEPRRFAQANWLIHQETINTCGVVHFKKTGFMTKKFSTGWIWLVISPA